MSKFAAVVRIAFGLLFLLNGVNFYLDLMPIVVPPHTPMGQFVEVLVSSGLMEIVKVIEVVTGITLLANRWVPLSAVIAMPVTVGVVFNNLVLSDNVFIHALGIVTLGLNLAVLLAYLRHFRPMLRMRTEPGFSDQPSAYAAQG